MAYQSIPGTEDDETDLCKIGCRRMMKTDRYSTYQKKSRDINTEKRKEYRKEYYKKFKL